MQLRVTIHQRDFRITEHTALKKKIQTKQGSCILINEMQLNLKVNIPVLKKQFLCTTVRRSSVLTDGPERALIYLQPLCLFRGPKGTARGGREEGSAQQASPGPGTAGSDQGSSSTLCPVWKSRTRLGKTVMP